MFEGGYALKWVLWWCHRRRYCWICFAPLSNFCFGVGDFIFLELIFSFTDDDFIFYSGDFCFLALILFCSW